MNIDFSNAISQENCRLFNGTFPNELHPTLMKVIALKDYQGLNKFAQTCKKAYLIAYIILREEHGRMRCDLWTMTGIFGIPEHVLKFLHIREYFENSKKFEGPFTPLLDPNHEYNKVQSSILLIKGVLEEIDLNDCEADWLPPIRRHLNRFLPYHVTADRLTSHCLKEERCTLGQLAKFDEMERTGGPQNLSLYLNSQTIFNDNPDPRSCAQILSRVKNLAKVKSITLRFNPYTKILHVLKVAQEWQMIDELILSPYDGERIEEEVFMKLIPLIEKRDRSIHIQLVSSNWRGLYPFIEDTFAIAEKKKIPIFISFYLNKSILSEEDNLIHKMCKRYSDGSQFFQLNWFVEEISLDHDDEGYIEMFAEEEVDAPMRFV